jgi:hypothetical protein
VYEIVCCAVPCCILAGGEERFIDVDNVIGVAAGKGQQADLQLFFELHRFAPSQTFVG